MWVPGQECGWRQDDVRWAHSKGTPCREWGTQKEVTDKIGSHQIPWGQGIGNSGMTGETTPRPPRWTHFSNGETGMPYCCLSPGGHWRTGETGLHIGACCVISAFCHHFLYLSRNFTSLLCVGYILPFHHTVTHIVTAILTHPQGSGQGHCGDRKAFSIRTELSLPLPGLLRWEEGT